MISQVFKHLHFLYRQNLLKFKIGVIANLLKSPDAWHALDSLKIPGWGTQLIRFDYPPASDLKPCWGENHTPHPQLKKIIDRHREKYEPFLKGCLVYAERCQAWPDLENPALPSMPWKKNVFLEPFDQLSIYGMLRQLKPARYLEIGSGMSTRIAWQARKDGEFPMEIISIDPGPRIEVAALCDKNYPRRLEEMQREILSLATSDTTLFFDGSHCCFPSSDVTCFFLNILPALPSGAVVHIHDIFLPFDYPKEARQRYWSEQYLLAAMLLGGNADYEVILPCAYLTARENDQTELRTRLGNHEVRGSGFWLQKRAS